MLLNAAVLTPAPLRQRTSSQLHLASPCLQVPQKRKKLPEGSLLEVMNSCDFCWLRE